ncbi:uncharacterized protein NPIL_208061 [Nephila pilipes]|uniref:Uncharacterized protein n=1 Tax=Nephila pilipes TaxID=299642 RepID=A0A8X6TAS7_NEPPI|nr:uncharacterized protein NPIL_208061 [Nephila pilipes]
MQEKCCFGCCFLSTGTAIALSISAVQALVGLLWNIQLLLLLNESDAFNPLEAIIDVKSIEDVDAVHGLVMAAIGLNGFWLIFAVVAAVGNVTLQHSRLLFWDRLTILIAFFDVGVSVFFAFKLQVIFADSSELYMDSKPTKTLTYLILLMAFSKGGITIFLNVYLAYIVQKRGKEICHDQSALAMYIISNISRSKTINYSTPHRPEQAPAYASSSPYYVPPPPTSRCDNRSDSSGSQWSLSYDAIRGMSSDQPKFISPTGRKKCSTLELARALSRESCHEAEAVAMETSTSPVLPY